MSGGGGMTAAQRKMHHIAEEMMETEAQYVQSLIDVEDGFLIPCMHFRKPIGPLEPLDVEIVFANIQALRGLHEEFLGALNSIMISPSFAGEIFYDNVEKFKEHYVEYCGNTGAAMETLTAWLSDPKIAEFLAKLSRERNKPLGLAPELLKPVQRILKYPLLLRELLKVSEPGSDGYSNAERAVEQLNLVAEEINERKRSAENMENVLNLERRLDGHKASLLDYGLMLRSGHFRVIESRKSRTNDRWLFLFEKGLLITREESSLRTKEENSVKLHFKNFIELSNLAVTLGKGDSPDKCFFEVNGSVGDKLNTYTVYCTTPKVRDEWANQMNDMRNNSLVAFLKAKATNVKFADQDGTVGLNRDKMRLREERLVQLRSRKKGEKIPPVAKTALTLYKQAQRMPVQRTTTNESTTSAMGPRTTSAVDLQTARPPRPPTVDVDAPRTATQSPTEDAEPSFARKKVPVSPIPARQSRPPSSPPPPVSSPPPPPPGGRRMSTTPGVPDMREVTATRSRSLSIAGGAGPPPALPPPRANRQSLAAPCVVPDLDLPEPATPPTTEPTQSSPLRPDSREVVAPPAFEAPKPKLVRPPGPPLLRGPPPPIGARPTSPAVSRSTQPRAPAPKPPAPGPERRKSPVPPVAPKPAPPPGLGLHTPPHVT